MRPLRRSALSDEPRHKRALAAALIAAPRHFSVQLIVSAGSGVLARLSALRPSPRRTDRGHEIAY